MRKRTLKSTRKKKERQSKADPKRELRCLFQSYAVLNSRKTVYHGDRARYHYFQCLQLLLRMQVAALTRLWELPSEFEVGWLPLYTPLCLTFKQIVCRDIWALHLSLLPEPPPAEPLKDAHLDSEARPAERDASARENSLRGDESKDDGGDEDAAERSSSESSASSSDDDSDEATDDPEMAELMRQAEEIPSSSDDDDDDEREGHEGSAQKVPAHRKTKGRFGRKYDMPMNNLAVLVVACWTLRLPVTYMDFVRHADRCIATACRLNIPSAQTCRSV